MSLDSASVCSQKPIIPFQLKRLSQAVLLAASLSVPLTPLMPAFAVPAPEIILANSYESGIELADYWVSEKYDGVRGYWDGKQLLTRSGNIIAAPGWFTAPLPDTALDGELWIGRGRFSEVSAIVRSKRASDAQWRRVRFMAFDLPDHPGSFDQRLTALSGMVKKINQPHLQLVKQHHIPYQANLYHMLDEVVELGGEGLMLHLGSSRYNGGRSDDLLKLKKYQDAEARVVSILPGKSKFKGMMGAMVVELADGRQFRIGTGFSDQQRRHPPAPGTVVTFKYYGKTKTGLPRFASFLRVREES